MKEDTIPKQFLENVRKLKGRVAMREKKFGVWERTTWDEYWEHVRNFALGLKTMGFEEGDVLAILGDNCREWLYADLAAQCSAGVAAGIYPTDIPEQVHYICRDSKAKLVVAKDQEQVDKVLEVKDDLPLLKAVVVIDTKGLRKYNDPLLTSFQEVEDIGEKYHHKHPHEFNKMITRTRHEDMATIIYTSGTTGEPKGVMLTHKNMITMIDGYAKIISLTERDSLVSSLPLCHIGERIFSLLFPMSRQVTINFAESVNTLQDDLREISPTAFLNVPRIWEKMYSSVMIRMEESILLKRLCFRAMMPIGRKVAGIKMSGKRPPLHWKILYAFAYLLLFRALRNQLGLLNVRIAVGGAAPLSEDLLKFYYSIGLPIQEAYGMSEATGMSSVSGRDEVRPGAVGRPIPGVKIKLAEDGEILIGGDTVFRGYLNKPEKTDAVLKDGWIYSGDIGQWDEEGFLRITDRKKDIIVTSGGKNIAPSAIENKLKFSPYIKEAIVIGDRRKFPSVLIQIDPENVGNWAQKRLIPYTTYKSLATTAEIKELISGVVEEANSHFARVERVKKFKILEKELDPDDDELTGTMKVKRGIIEKKFKTLIDEIYNV